MRHRAVLLPLLQAVTRERTTADWIALLETCAVPCGPINDIGQAFADAQVQARELAVTQTRADGLAIRSVASPIRLSATPPVLRHAPPALGEHTAQVLDELGVDGAAQAAWRARGVIA